KHVACLFGVFSFLILRAVIVSSAVWVVVMMLFSPLLFLFIKTVYVVFAYRIFKIRMFHWLRGRFYFHLFNQLFRVYALFVPLNNLFYSVNGKLYKCLCIAFVRKPHLTFKNI